MLNGDNTPTLDKKEHPENTEKFVLIKSDATKEKRLVTY